MQRDQSPRATGLAGAGVALADAPDAVFFNPAGLVDLPGTMVMGSLSTNVRDVSFRPFDRSASSGDDSFDPGASFFVTHALAKDLAGGIGVLFPWSFDVDWNAGDDFRGRFFATSTRFRALDVTAALAYRIDERWSVGVGIDIVGGDFENARFEQDPALSALGGGDPIALARTDFDFSGTDVGWNAAVRGRPIDRVTVGLQFRDEVELDLAGAARFSLVAPASLRDFRLPDGARVGELLEERFETQVARLKIVLPRTVVFGAAFEAGPRLRFVGEAQWTDWEEAGTLGFVFADPTLDDRVALDFEGAWTVRGGLEYRDPTGVVLRAGYAREESPAPLVGVTPLLPDGDRDTFTLGAGIRWAGFDIDGGYRVSLQEDREGIAFPSSVTADGLFETIEHRFSVGISRRL